MRTISSDSRAIFKILEEIETLEESTNQNNRTRNITLEDCYDARLLRKFNDFYSFLINSLASFIFILDKEGKFVFVSEQVYEILGYRAKNLIGMHFSQLVDEADLSMARHVFLERRISERASYNVEFRLKRKLPDQYESTTTIKTSLCVSCSSIGIYSEYEKIEENKYLGSFGIINKIVDMKGTNGTNHYHENCDILTGLPNKYSFLKEFDFAKLQAIQNETSLVLMIIDLDQFKLINDSYGLEKGDELLRQVANRIQRYIKQTDTLMRMGGDEFVLLLEGINNQQDTACFTESLLISFREPFHLGNKKIKISASIGVACYPQDGETVDELLTKADLAMQDLKAKGKNGYRFFNNSMLNHSNVKMIVNQDLSAALDKNEFEMYYQPQVNAVSCQVVGAEALIRWNHPERGLLTAGAFIDYIEDSGFIIPITEWVINDVMQTLHDWNSMNYYIDQISINISPTYLERLDFVAQLTAAMKHYSVRPEQIEIEILENFNIFNSKHIIDQLWQLRKLGVKIAIDDFGTGYSSLNYLKHFPIDTIKLDQSFVREIKEDNISLPILSAIISIAHELKLNLIAEGVETFYQSNYLRKHGCYWMQGYLYSKPLPKNQFVEILKTKEFKFAT
ncbi:bifunctional diguanylate cyclase/phosphodiesterase [Nitrosomonas sp. Is35]|uniref:sensor domain-containing protein n=1 Tax=unclassified Nitrosomonas TaxID=2609265 RepID=UPI00294B8DB9|nr:MULTISPECIES: bifunctional diguanylate cyclase/phosphodiesterase [unclassified Nitrosomonas]MDV6342464.1 bifunctional diguanylate cyclase/phosphodiesterase [Nitrosomonas sp. Is24]MDV6348368.1 bifunctional diguanylate cyclase/phosphodiesterase [Nitrosomonas sp. Is35]